MKSPLKDEEVISLYKEDATETPAKELDEKILGYATQQTRVYKPWWPYMGVAASVMLLVLIAPWKWSDPVMLDASGTQNDTQPVHEPMEMQQNLPEVEPMMSRSIMKAAPEVMSSQMLDAGSMTDEAFEPDGMLNPFEEVEARLAKGDKKEAKQLLTELLSKKPELVEWLPDHLSDLLVDEG